MMHSVADRYLLASRAASTTHFLLRCLLGIGGAIVVTWLQLRVEHFAGPFLPLFFWCLTCSTFLGTGPSLVVIAVSTLLTNYLFVAPCYTFSLGNSGALSSAAFATLALMVLWFITSIVRHTRLQEKILQQTRETAEKNAALAHALETAVKMRDNFVATASHELRTPLTHLYLRVQNWNRRLADQDRAIDRKQITQAWADQQRGIERLVRMVDQLLDVSRIDLEHLDFQPSLFSITSTVADIADRFKEDLRQAGNELIIYGEDVGDWMWDRERFDQVLSNLVTNACKYAPGAPIVLQWSKWRDELIFRVHDFGPGLTAEAKKGIFGRFERLDAKHSKIHGLGLGLWICKNIVDAAKGSIDLFTEEGLGCQFILRLPSLTARPCQDDAFVHSLASINRRSDYRLMAMAPSRR